jgi:hypothetical protein
MSAWTQFAGPAAHLGVAEAVKGEARLPAFDAAAAQGVAIRGFGHAQRTRAQFAVLQHLGVAQGHRLAGRPCTVIASQPTRFCPKSSSVLPRRRLRDGDGLETLRPAHGRADPAQPAWTNPRRAGERRARRFVEARAPTSPAAPAVRHRFRRRRGCSTGWRRSPRASWSSVTMRSRNRRRTRFRAAPAAPAARRKCYVARRQSRCARETSRRPGSRRWRLALPGAAPSRRRSGSAAARHRPSSPAPGRGRQRRRR